MSTVSVIVPNYNRASLIGGTLDNLLAQTLRPHEIIVVDDGSTDDSVAVIQQFGRAIHLIQQANRGPGAARNAGLAVTTGEFIQFQDSDDLLSLNKLEAQARVMEQTGADLVYSPFVKGCIADGVFTPEDVVLQQAPLPSHLPLHEWVLRGLSIVFQACLLRRTFLDRCGGYRTDLMPSEDSELLFRMGLRGARLAFCPEALTVYRLHQMNQITSTGTLRGERLKDWARMLLIMHAQLVEQSVKLARRTEWFALSELWNTRQWLDRLGCDEPELKRKLEAQYAAYPDGFHAMIRFLRRLSARWRWQLYGNRWHSFYHSSPPTPAQVELLAKMGLTLNLHSREGQSKTHNAQLVPKQ